MTHADLRKTPSHEQLQHGDPLNPQFVRLKLALHLVEENRILAQEDKSRVFLPRLDLDRWLRAGPQIQAYCRTRWSIDCRIIDILFTPRDGEALIIAQVRHAFRGMPSLRVADLSDLEEDELSGNERTAMESVRTTGETGRGPFASTQWLEMAERWSLDRLPSTERSHIERIEQYTIEPDRCLLRLRLSSGKAYWLKAGRAPEYQIIQCLRSVVPTNLPSIIAYHPYWNAFLMNDSGTSLEQFPNLSSTDLTRISWCTGRLQKRSIVCLPELRLLAQQEVSMHSVRPRLIPALVSIHEDFEDEWVGPRLKISLDRLLEIESALSVLMTEARDLQLPEALIHDDLHRGNVLMHGRDVVLVDWELIRVGFPFEMLEQLYLLTSRRSGSRQLQAAAYAAGWSDLLSKRQIRRATMLSRPLSIATRLLNSLVADKSHNNFLPFSVQHRQRVLLGQLDRSLRDLTTAGSN